MQDAPQTKTLLCGAGLLWSWSYLFFFTNQEGVLGPLYNDLAYLAATLVAPLVVALCLARKEPLGQTPRRLPTTLAVLGCLMLLAGTLLTVYLAENPGASAAGKALSGLGQALFWIAWGSLLARSEIGQVESSVLLWTPLLAASALVAAVLKTLPAAQPLFALFFCLLPAASLGMYLRAERASNGVPAACGEPVRAQSWLRSEGLFSRLASLALASGALSLAMGTFGLAMPSSPSQQLLSFAVAAAATFGVAWVSLQNTRRYDLATLYRWALPVVAVAVGAFVAGGSGTQTVAFLLLTIASVGFELMAKLYVVHMAARSNVNKTLAVAVGFAMPALGCIVPVLVWIALSRSASAEPLASLMAVPMLFALAVSLGMGRDNEPERPKASPADTEPPRKESENAALESLAAEAGLSPRETEILSYLARGCSRTYIREELYLSKGTVDTHVNHIYRKLAISSKDELMRLVESRGERLPG